MTAHDIWDDVALSPAEATSWRLASDLFDAIVAVITAWGWTTAQAAGAMGTSTSRVHQLTGGEFSAFSLDQLVELAGVLGLDIRVQGARRD
jgi:predicted XRE-type DNA-binding protein